MINYEAFRRNLVAGSKNARIFDWIHAATLIFEADPIRAEAGLLEDWDKTGATILTRDAGPLFPQIVWLRSNWATPILVLDDEPIPCYIPAQEAPLWGPQTLWPPSAVSILLGRKE